ncbi:PqqD family protein [Rothia sp. 11273D007AR]
MPSVFRRSPVSATATKSSVSDEAQTIFYVANLMTSELSVLEGSSVLIWELLEKPYSLEELLIDVSDIYGVEQELVSPGINDFLEAMQQQGLVVLDEVAEPMPKTGATD